MGRFIIQYCCLLVIGENICLGQVDFVNTGTPVLKALHDHSDMKKRYQVINSIS